MALAFLTSLCYAVMLTWHQVDNRPLCVFYSKPDFTLTGRSYRARGGTFFILPDSQYADDTAVLFISRESLENSSSLLIAHFAKFGLSIHVGTAKKDSKTEILTLTLTLTLKVSITKTYPTSI